MATDDAITLARLDGTARRVLQHDVPRTHAIAELHAITRRRDLLEQAGGAALGSWQHNRAAGWQGRDVAELMVEAGADRDQVAEHARQVIAKLSHASPGGVGAPRS